MLAEQSQIISLTQLAVVAGCSRDHITQLYLHWTAGRYGQVYDDYHLNIDADGTVYRTSSSLSQYKSHTWRRNSGSIAVALCCGLGAQANHGYDADLGQFAPTAVQTDKMAQTVALLVTALGLQLTYYRYRNDPLRSSAAGWLRPLQRRRRNTLGLVVYARFTRRRTDEAGWGHTARQSSLVFRTQ